MIDNRKKITDVLSIDFLVYWAVFFALLPEKETIFLDLVDNNKLNEIITDGSRLSFLLCGEDTSFFQEFLCISAHKFCQSSNAFCHFFHMI